jgi:uncharacterized protein YhfF
MSRISPTRADVVQFLQEASEALNRQLPPPKDVFSFAGEGESLSDELLELAIKGDKTGTTSWPVPNPRHWDEGDLSVILDSTGRPSAIMRTLSLTEYKFKDVPEDFALSEGEGDYEEYRRGHFSFYSRQENGDKFGDDSLVLCERFEILYSRASEVISK